MSPRSKVQDAAESRVSARAAPAATVCALDDATHFQLAFGNPANAVGAKVGVPSLNAAQAAQVLIALLLPLCNQVFVCIAFFNAVFIEFSAYGFPFVKEVKDIAGLLVMDPEDGPQRFHFPLPLMGFSFSFSHLLIQFIQRWFDQLPAIWRCFPASFDFGHFPAR